MQIIGNLISNAIKFTPEGGSVSISLSLEEKNYINNLRAKISDTGTGMTAAQIEEILNGESQTTQGTAGELGYGFGLPLVKHLIDGLGEF